MTRALATQPLNLHADYMRDVVNRPSDVCKEAARLLTGIKFDTLVGTGVSGAMILSLLAARLRKRFAFVRKPNDGSHSYTMIEGSIGSRWLFVDDLVASGDSIKRVHAAIQQHVVVAKNHNTAFVGCFLYHGLWGNWNSSNLGYFSGGYFSPEQLAERRDKLKGLD